MSASNLLVVLILLIVIGAFPVWPYSHDWGYYPSGGGLLLVVLLLLLVTRRA